MSSNLANQFDLKDEEQAKEYLDTLGVEYRYQCYQENIPEGCHRLGDFFEAFRKDHQKALTVYNKNCTENKYGHSCFKYGNYKLLGRGCDKDFSEALRYHRLGCDYGHTPSCHNAGLVMSTTKLNTEPNYKEALEFFKKGCAGGDVPCCSMVSNFFIAGKPGVQKDMNKAFEFASKACDMGHMYACANLSIMYKNGEGVDANPELSLKFKERAQQLQKDVTTHESQLKFGQ